MANWSELPGDILEFILKRLTCISDQIRFKGVCATWRLVAKQCIQGQIPGIMLPLAAKHCFSILQGTRNLGSSKNKRCGCPLPLPLPLPLPVLSVPEDYCCGSHQGWLVMINKDVAIYLLNAFSDARIELPSVPSSPQPTHNNVYLPKIQVKWAILSNSPSSSISDRTVLILCVGYSYYSATHNNEFAFNNEDCVTVHKLVFCKLGDGAWRFIDSPKQSYFSSAIYFGGQFYFVDEYGSVYVSDLNAACPVMTKLLHCNLTLYKYFRKWYLVEVEGKLLRVGRRILGPGSPGKLSNSHPTKAVDIIMMNQCYTTCGFEIHKLDFDKKKCVPVSDMGEYALFLGLNNSFALSELNSLSIKGNKLYFTNDAIELLHHHYFWFPGREWGIFCLKDFSKQPLALPLRCSQRINCPAVWVTL